MEPPPSRMLSRDRWLLLLSAYQITPGFPLNQALTSRLRGKQIREMCLPALEEDGGTEVSRGNIAPLYMHQGKRGGKCSKLHFIHSSIPKILNNHLLHSSHCLVLDITKCKLGAIFAIIRFIVAVLAVMSHCSHCKC